ncbi:AAA family ATPase [Campylobacter sp. RM16190]|uniref:AAA family ATPase n=1 Tax=Campylobacter sp. RM16190 TaxID=1705727 RepID=UPI001475095B|nr:AAA family ATPase [Campylobacter sp. RM16190]
MTNKERFSKLLEILNEGLIEKEQAISLTLLSLIAGKSIFLFGPPGTAKSLVARRVSKAFASDKFFDYLMNRFSTPEEIFGPLKLSELRKDRLERQIKGFLPDADFAFLDEIWKSSPAILNSLLTIINEKRFTNGSDVIKVPLKGLVAASNEFPQEGQGLEALYDRFVLRLVVPRIEKKSNFKLLLSSLGANENIEISDELKISEELLSKIIKDSKSIKIGSAILDVIVNIKNKITKYNNNIQKQDETEIELSDDIKIIDISERRWINIMGLLRVSAVANDRQNIELSDVLLLKHTLWEDESQIQAISQIIDEAISKKIAQVTNFDGYKNTLDSVAEVFKRQEYYDGVKTIDKEAYLKLNIDGEFYANLDGLNSGNLNPALMLKDGVLVPSQSIKYKFIKNENSQEITVYNYSSSTIPTRINYALNPRPPKKEELGDIIYALDELKNNIDNNLNRYKSEVENFFATNSNIFISKKENLIAIQNISSLVDELESLKIQTINLKKEMEKSYVE